MEQSHVSVGPVAAARLTKLVSVGILFGALNFPIDVSAQVVTPKTLPVHQSGQFDMYPSARAGMAGAMIAVDDTLLDPFVNPAKAIRFGSSQIFVAPFFHSISGGRGGGRSLPIGGGGSWGDWAATGLFTFQQIDRAGPTFNLATTDRSVSNEYLAGSFARRLSPSTTVGVGLQIASLNAIDGVDLLYAGSDRINQSGGSSDIRVGFNRELAGARNLEILLVRARSDMRHDVHFTTWRWDSVTHRSIQTQRAEVNEDKTHIWGLHSEYTIPIGSEGWRLGWLGTANRLSHPKIPNYVIQNIPRDPGTTHAFNAGAGIGRTSRSTSFAADLIYEPMFADTWADAASDTSVAGGGIIKAGGKTVENTFRFNNLKLRFGAGREVLIRRDGSSQLGIQLGLGLHSIKYKLQQANHVLRTFRTQREGWVEWSPTFGLRLRSREMDLLYNFSLTCGPGSCGLTQGGFPVFGPVAEAVATGGIIAAPSGQLFMQSGSLTVHKITIVMPIH